MAGKEINRKKHPRIHAQAETFYEAIRQEQQRNLSSPGAALLGLIRDTVKRLDKVVGELNDLRNAIGMSEHFVLAKAGVYDRSMQLHDGKSRASKRSPTQRATTAKKPSKRRSRRSKSN